WRPLRSMLSFYTSSICTTLCTCNMIEVKQCQSLLFQSKCTPVFTRAGRSISLDITIREPDGIDSSFLSLVSRWTRREDGVSDKKGVPL
ncbi:MAG: hypothetical protein K8S24_04355, partial [Candidatus Aegiribacteria sp.]|nr:hypothetical protein [Candidatus Aegiribacteria sp.]